MRTAPIRLLVVLPANLVGGAETLTRTLLSALQGFDITLLTQAALAPLFEGLPIRIRRFDDDGLRAPYDYRPGNSLAYARAVAACAAQTDAQIVYGVMHNAALFLALARLRHPLRMAGRRVAGSVHGVLSVFFQQEGRAPSRYESLLLGIVFRSLDSILVPSHGVAEDLTANFGAPPGKMVTVHNGFRLDAIRAAAQEGPEPEKRGPWILTACRLSPQKDPITLVEAFAAVAARRPARLVIMGDGPLRPQVEARIAELGLGERATLTGYLSNPFPWIARADVFVLSSFWEGFGNVLVEAMALGVPVVASDCPSGPAEIVEQGKSGFLVPVQDPAALAERLETLLADGALRAAMAERAITRAGHFTERRMVDEYRAYFRALLDRRAGPLQY